jgi:sulfur relay (sulfurtransferase) DsrC/TusE family protein
MHQGIRQAHKRRLHYLRVQVARNGYSTDPAIRMEIKDIKRRLKKKTQSVTRITHVSHDEDTR